MSDDVPRTVVLTDAIVKVLRNPLTRTDIDLHAKVAEVLADVGMTLGEFDGKLTFYGKDPVVPSSIRFGTMAATALAARTVALAALWRDRTGEGQDVHVDLRKATRRFAGFFDRRWELINGRPPSTVVEDFNSFIQRPLFQETRDGRFVMPLNIYPAQRRAALQLLGCVDSPDAVRAAIKSWYARDLEDEAADFGVTMGMLRTTSEFMQEPQFKDVLADSPLIYLEKMCDSEPVPFAGHPVMPLDGIRALGMGHAIAGAAIGRDLASYGADVLNTWHPLDIELETYYWASHVGMRSTVLGHSPDDRAVFNELLAGADVFFANKHPGYLHKHGMSAEELCGKTPGLVHVSVLMHGGEGPWAARAGFDLIGAAVAGIFDIEGTNGRPGHPPIVPICDYAVGWLATTGVIQALRRRAVEGGSFKVTVSVTRAVLWQISLGIFDKQFALDTAGSSDEHCYIPPDVFSAETSLGHYQGIADQVTLPRSPSVLRHVLVPRGSNKPVWEQP